MVPSLLACVLLSHRRADGVRRGMDGCCTSISIIIEISESMMGPFSSPDGIRKDIIDVDADAQDACMAMDRYRATQH